MRTVLGAVVCFAAMYSMLLLAAAVMAMAF